MQQDNVIADFLDNDHRDMWRLITENKTADLLQQIKPQQHKQSILAKLFGKKSPPIETDVLHTIVYELLEYGESNTLKSLEFKIMDANSDTLFKDLTRLLFALEINGQFVTLENIIGDKLYLSTEKIAAEIKEKANGYPANPINGQVWMGGAGMRAAFSYLAYYHEKNNFPKSQLWVIKMRTIITLNIMGHYKASVGPDMIEVAELEEKLDLADEALGRYKAVIMDFEDELDFFNDNLEEGPDYDDHIILSSLLKSYQSVDRIEHTTKYKNEIAIIEQILKREIPNE